MRPCCPPGEGCNCHTADERCALIVLSDDPAQDARQALQLWERYQQAGSRRGRRFLRRAYARARDRALGQWTPWGGSRLGRAA